MHVLYNHVTILYTMGVTYAVILEHEYAAVTAVLCGV